MVDEKAPIHRGVLEESEVHLSDYLNVVLRRWKLVLLVFLLVFIGVATFTFLKQPIYEASATLAVAGKNQSGLLQELEIGGESPIETEIQKLRSITLLSQVVRQLNLQWQEMKASEKTAFNISGFSVEGDLGGLRIELTGTDSYQILDLNGNMLCEAPSGSDCILPQGFVRVDLLAGAQKGQFVEYEQRPITRVAESLLGSLQVTELGQRTNVIRVSYRGTDPAKTRDVVNLLTETYLARNVANRTQEAGKAVDFISQQLEGVKSRLDRSEQDLQEFKVQTGLATLGPEGNSLVEKMVTLEQQQAELKLKRERIEYAIASLEEALNSNQNFTPPTIEGAPQIAELANQLAGLQAQKKALLADFTPAHPRVVEVDSKIQQIKEAMLSGYQTIRQEILLGERDLGKTIAGLEKQLEDIPEVELELAKRLRVNEVNAELYTFLMQKQQEARIAQESTISSAQVIDPALTPRNPVAPNKKKNLALGFILGLMLGVGLAFLLDYMDQTIKTVEDVRSKLGLNVFGILPRIPFADEDAKLPRKRLVTTLDPKAPVVEAFRALRTNLKYITGKKNHRIIMVTSSLPGEGKSTVSGNLAVILSQTGAKVLLMGCDLRRPELYEMFGVPSKPGLTDLLADGNLKGLHKIANPRLDFLPGGTIPPNPAELLQSVPMSKILKTVRERYDYVVIDAPPILPVTDSQILAPLVDINLVVLEPCRVPEKVALQMVESLEAVDAKIAGVVMNDKSGRGFKYYGNYNYYGGKYYRGYYGESEDELESGAVVGTMKKIWGKLNS